MTSAQQFGVVYFPYEEFDERGNKVYWENQDGYWVKWEYDEHGNKVHREDSDGMIWGRES
jgi:YD repeat-containing protein